MKNEKCMQCGTDTKCGSCGKCQKCGCGGCACSRLKKFAFSMASGFTIGLLLLVLGLFATYYHDGVAIVSLLASVFKGYEPTLMGAIYGGLWGFLTGFVMGLVLASLYNCCLCCFICRRKCGECKK